MNTLETKISVLLSKFKAREKIGCPCVPHTWSDTRKQCLLHHSTKKNSGFHALDVSLGIYMALFAASHLPQNDCIHLDRWSDAFGHCQRRHMDWQRHSGSTSTNNTHTRLWGRLKQSRNPGSVWKKCWTGLCVMLNPLDEYLSYGYWFDQALLTQEWPSTPYCSHGCVVWNARRQRDTLMGGKRHTI